MTYLRVNDTFPTHPKVVGVVRRKRDSILGLWLRMGTFSSNHLTDGKVPATFFETRSEKERLQVMVDVGLVDDVDEQGFYTLHDYLDWNRSRAEVDALSEKRKRAGTCGGEAKALASAKQDASNDPPIDTEVQSTEVHKKTKGLSLDANQGIPDGLYGYWLGKLHRDPEPEDIRSLKVMLRTFDQQTLTLAIGQAVTQGHGADNYALITTIAKAEMGTP